jgi:3-(methylsulfanyl)propanoyl-CoA dehydrogenase
MPSYKAPLRDIRFVLDEVLDISQLSRLPGFEDATPELLFTVIEEGAKICEEVLFPLNQSGDAEGCTLENGQVRTPAGFKEAYRTYVEGGWPALDCNPAFGGQGLPYTARFVMEEMLCASNQSFSMYPGLTHGAYGGLNAHASDELKQRYLAKLVSGEWSGTMCLTEAQAGTDLGLITTKAVAAGDGAYRITGTKIFISAGDHDLTENIIHLVLAKLPGAPAGTRGISMFLVPKLLPTDEGRPGTRNGVRVGSIEHKMGIKGSATCVLDFEDAVGWLVGEENRGLQAMFTLMNGARLAVGIQGLGLAEVAYQNAVAYARDRLQGRSLKAKQGSAAAEPIIVHPDVRRGLMMMKAFIEGARCLAYWVGMEIDISTHHPDPERRRAADDLVALMTPIVKAFLTDRGFDATNIALQTFGGHGYIREFGVEQYVRDARIGMIYEGTNGVQAMDLVGRKMLEGDGRLVKRFVSETLALIEASLATPALAEMANALGAALEQVVRASRSLGERAQQDPDELGAAATDYLQVFGLVAVGAMWLRTASVCVQRLAGGGETAFYATKLKTARFFFARMLPEVSSRVAAMGAGAGVIMDVGAEEL